MKNEETQKVVEKKEVGDNERAMLSTPCEVHEYDKTTYELEIPEIVLTELGMSFITGKDKLQFIKENGRVYIEKA